MAAEEKEREEKKPDPNSDREMTSHIFGVPSNSESICFVRLSPLIEVQQAAAAARCGMLR